MVSSTFLKIIFILLTLSVLCRAVWFSFENCGDTPLQIRQLDLHVEYPNNDTTAPKLNLTVKTENTDYISSKCKTQFYLAYTLERRIGTEMPYDYLTIPCEDRWVGSCNRTVNCVKKIGCPWPIGDQTFSTVLSEAFLVPEAFEDQLINGEYRFSAELREIESNKQVACIAGLAHDE